MKLLKFYADWCGPCKILTKMLEEEDFGVEIEVESIDIMGDDPRIAKFGVRAIPLLVVVDEEGNPIREVTGAQKAQTLREFICPTTPQF